MRFHLVLRIHQYMIRFELVQRRDGKTDSSTGSRFCRNAILVLYFHRESSTPSDLFGRFFVLWTLGAEVAVAYLGPHCTLALVWGTAIDQIVLTCIEIPLPIHHNALTRIVHPIESPARPSSERVRGARTSLIINGS